MLSKSYAIISRSDLYCLSTRSQLAQEKSSNHHFNVSPLSFAFPGGSCFPLSDDSGKHLDRNERLDQLSVIFSVIGTPCEEDVTSIGQVLTSFLVYYCFLSRRQFFSSFSTASSCFILSMCLLQCRPKNTSKVWRNMKVSIFVLFILQLTQLR